MSGIPDHPMDAIFFNISFVSPEDHTRDFFKQPHGAFFVPKQESLNEGYKEVKAYFYPSVEMTDLKKSCLQEAFFERADFGIDPFSLGLWQSQLFKSRLVDECVRLVSNTDSRLFRLSGQAYKMAGASDSQELAILLSSILQLEQDYEGLLEPETLWTLLSLEVTLSPHVFGSMNKLQAMRSLCQRIQELGPEVNRKDLPIYGTPSFRHLAAREPWTNLLRLTAMQTAALLGRAQGFVSLPFDFLSQNRGGRKSQNSLEVLMQESHLSRVAHPSFGSPYSHEMLDELCEQAWTLFVEIEKKGGLVECLRSGWLQEEVETQAQKEERGYRDGSKVMTGVNQFALPQSLDKKFPLVQASEVKSLETFWQQYSCHAGAEKLCDVKRMVPRSLSQEFESWQFRGSEAMKNQDKDWVPVLVESNECRQKKWQKTSQTLGLAGLVAKETSLPEIKNSPLVIVIASAPDSEFALSTLRDLRNGSSTQVIWAGEKKVDGFDGCLNHGERVFESFRELFDILERQ